MTLELIFFTLLTSLMLNFLLNYMVYNVILENKIKHETRRYK